MKRFDMTRRQFHELTMAAFGGLVAGSAIGCGTSEEGGGTGADAPAPGGAGKDTGEGADGQAAETQTAALNACRGLNVCKGHGKGDHDCAGKGSCFTVEAHECAGLNTCKNLGGCGASAGGNECAEKGGCAVPMMNEDVWKRARASFEERMKAQGKAVGDAPPAQG